ncbi:MAG TPA: prolipoprotein diacylglyceryl transferase [Micromonosporaceae bacterium]|nr:prolipoprotein diacylglyceryl transferase [Micromonosporaceae bacterium]
MNYASIPSPATSVWHLWFVPIRAYALCIVVGIIVACYITERRMRSRGAPRYVVLDIAVWAVPAGIIGARIYHVITSPQLYFGQGGNPVGVFYIWNGGLGIWGAVAGGAVGAWIACRRLGIPLSFVADAIAPALPVAQAIGRFGNWFNNELYGKATTLPWGLKVHAEMVDGKAVPVDGQLFLPGLYQPTFLYEVIWDLGVALLVFLLDRKYRFGRGRAFALYVMAYTAGRAWIEYLRIDQANHFIGLRVNDWVAIVVFLGALIYFVRVKGEQLILTPVAEPDGSAADSDVSTDDESDETRPAAGEAGDADADDEAADDTDAPTPRAHDDDPSAGGGTTPSASAAKK